MADDDVLEHVDSGFADLFTQHLLGGADLSSTHRADLTMWPTRLPPSV